MTRPPDARETVLPLGRCHLQPDARKAIQPDHLDQREDLRLGAAQQDRTALPAQPARKHGQIDDQRGVREYQPAQVDRHVCLRAERSHESAAPPALGGAVLITGAAQNRRFVLEVDDA